MQTRISHLEHGIPAGAITSYDYDSLDRLTGATERVGTSVNASWEYAYDDAGNRTSQTRTGDTGSTAGTITYTYDDAHRITSTSADTTTWSYDGAGNQLRNGITGQVATFNTRQGVSSIDTSTYTTFGQGNTTQLTRNGDAYNNARGMGLTYEALPGGVLRAYTRTSDGDAVGVRWGGMTRYYFATDALGSTIGVFDRHGVWGGGTSYSSYGETRAAGTGTGVSTNSLQYTGGYHDATTDLYKFDARYYDPALGRFTQHDPSGQEANPYLYAAGNPCNNTDPTGLRSCALSSVIAAGSTLLLAGAFATLFAVATPVAVAGAAASYVGTGLLVPFTWEDAAEYCS